MIEFNYTIIIQFFQFLILLILLNTLLFRPILGHLSKRRAAIRDLAERAEEKKEEAEGLSRTYDEGLKEKKLPILEEKEAALKEAHAASMKVIEEARRELAGELAKVREAVRTEAERTLGALVGESDRLAVEIAHKVTGRGA
jgi:F-type H+-transporting ATPase subunit b